LTEVTVATKIGSEELKRIDAIVRRRRLLNRSDLVREAIKLYLSLSGLKPETRLRMLRLMNESVGVSGKTASQLVEEARREGDTVRSLAIPTSRRDSALEAVAGIDRGKRAFRRETGQILTAHRHEHRY
jgi:Arc/MetJ-type ribon-helix-helix transcriptional regulator